MKDRAGGCLIVFILAMAILFGIVSNDKTDIITGLAVGIFLYASAPILVIIFIVLIIICILPDSTNQEPTMKLYIYDHCPFCVRARMIFGLRGIPVEIEVFANDDEAGPTALIGEKVVPILVKPDGTAMDESLDIVRFVDEYAGKERLDDTIRPEIQAWLDKVGKYSSRLTAPRCVQIGLPEFATESARAYYIAKKTAAYGDFAENIARTDEYLAQLHADLPELAALIHSEAHIGERLGYEDIITFPLLRNLTMVKGLQYPEQIRFYVERMAKQSGVPLYYDKAV